DLYIFFFFQAEDGIRDFHVTGVQTCALPISAVFSFPVVGVRAQSTDADPASVEARAATHIENARRLAGTELTAPFEFFCVPGNRSEERRVGKESRPWGRPDLVAK